MCLDSIATSLWPIANGFRTGGAAAANRQFQQLATTDRNEIYRMVWISNLIEQGKPNTHPRYGQIAFDGQGFQMDDRARAKAIEYYRDSKLTQSLLGLLRDFEEGRKLPTNCLRVAHRIETCNKFERLPSKIRYSVYYHVWKLKGDLRSPYNFGEVEFHNGLDGIQAEAIRNFILASHSFLKLGKERKKSLKSLPPPRRANKLFKAIAKNASCLLALPQSCHDIVCFRVRKDIQDLILATDTIASQIVVKEKNLQSNLIKIANDYSQLVSQCRNLTSELNQHESQLKGLKSKIGEINSSLEQQEGVIHSIKRQIDNEEDLRIKAAIDWIPGVGFFAGLITKDYDRMIPLHSTIKGIISVANQTLENQETQLAIKKNERDNLDSQMKETSKKFDDQNSKISKAKGTIAQLNGKRSSTDQEIKRLGQSLDSLRNTNQVLKTLLSKYKFLNIQVDVIQDLSTVNMLEDGDVVDFITEVLALRSSFSQMALTVSV